MLDIMLDITMPDIIMPDIIIQILSTDDAGYAAGSDTELTPVLMLVLMPVPFRPQCRKIFIFCRITYIDDAGSSSGYGAGYK